MEEHYLPQPLEPNQDVAREFEQRLRENFGGAHMNWPAQGQPLSDYSTPYLQSMAFPHLFPFGDGDVTKKDRQFTVTMTNANKHLVCYAHFNRQTEIWHYPFVEDARWVFWAQNTAERQRRNSQKTVYLAKNPEDANLTKAELREIVQGSGEAFQSLMGRMHSYLANIFGSPAYLYKARKELEALMDQEVVCSIWFSFFAADQQWFDLHQHLSLKNEIEFESEKEAAKFWRRMAANNPHLVDAFFFKRIQTMIETFFGPGCFEYKWFWHRGELQSRGVYHIHGCLRLKQDPNLTKLAEVVYNGRCAHRTSLPQRAAGVLFH